MTLCFRKPVFYMTKVAQPSGTGGRGDSAVPGEAAMRRPHWSYLCDSRRLYHTTSSHSEKARCQVEEEANLGKGEGGLKQAGTSRV